MYKLKLKTKINFRFIVFRFMYKPIENKKGKTDENQLPRRGVIYSVRGLYSVVLADVNKTAANYKHTNYDFRSKLKFDKQVSMVLRP